MMKKITLAATLVAILMPLIARSATAEELFVDAPLWLFPTLDRTTRLDMLDYYHSGSTHSSRNALNGASRVLSADSMQVTVETSASSQMQISILPMKRDSVIMVINTVKLSGSQKADNDSTVSIARDSNARFFTTDWKPSAKRLFEVPCLDDWKRPDSAVMRQDLENAVPFVVARLTYDPSTATLTLTNGLEDFLPEEDAATASAALLPTLTYKWTGSKLKRVAK